MGLIKIEGIRLYAYHGCMEEEGKIGGNYIVDVELETDFDQAMQTDKLSATVDYVKVYGIVKAQMAVRSKLIEHVAGRIAAELRQSFPEIANGKIKVTKLNPPMNGDVEKVCMEVEI